MYCVKNDFYTIEEKIPAFWGCDECASVYILYLLFLLLFFQGINFLFHCVAYLDAATLLIALL